MPSSMLKKFNFIGDMDATDEGSTIVEGWIQWFCSLNGHKLLCEVDREYIIDSFNLYGLRAKVENYDDALFMILGAELPDAEDVFEHKTLTIYGCAIELYALIHSRFILTNLGLSLMNDKYVEGKFGTCPRVHCNDQRVLPIGPSDQLKSHGMQLYCPSCQECFECKSRLDGAFFGPSFPAMFLQAYPIWVPRAPPVPYVPKLFGYSVHGKKSIIQIKLERGEYGFQCLQAEENRKKTTNTKSDLDSTKHSNKKD